MGHVTAGAMVGRARRRLNATPAARRAARFA
jgi:hypothetical protein